MNCEIRFDIAGFMIFCLLLLVVLVTKKAYMPRTKTFLVLLLLSITATAFDILTILAVNHPFAGWQLVHALLAAVHMASLSMIAPAGYVFICSLSNEVPGNDLKSWLTLHIPVILIVLACLTSPFTHWVTYYNALGIFEHDIGFYVVYAFSLIYLIAAIVHVIIHKKYLASRKRAAAISFLAANIISILIQMHIQTLLICCFCNSLSLMLSYIMLDNPAEFLDPNTLTYNQATFSESFTANHYAKSNYCVMCVKVANSDLIVNQFGVEKGYEMLREFSKELSKLSKGTDIFHLFEFCYASVFKSSKDAVSIAYKIQQYVTQKEDFSFPIHVNVFILRNIKPYYEYKSVKYPLTSDILTEALKYITNTYKDSAYDKISFIDQKMVNSYMRYKELNEIVMHGVNNYSFEVYMQPIFDTQEKKYLSTESLIRIKDKDGNLVLPSEFIETTERNGAILPICEISLKKTCQFMATDDFKKLGIETVIIRLSQMQFMQQYIGEKIISIVDSYNINRRLIRFEIIESPLYLDNDRFVFILHQLHDAGFEFTLDDYGEGYYNMSNLLDYNYTEVKFNKKFVNSLASSERNRNFLKNQINMFKEAGMKTLIEGVETKEQADFVTSVGVDSIQGFFFAKPMHTDEFIEFIRENNNV